MTAPTIPPQVLVRRLEFVLESVAHRALSGLDVAVQLKEAEHVLTQLKEVLR